MAEKVVKPSDLIVCDICHHEFHLTKDHIEEQKVILQKEGLDDKIVQLTNLTCPRCGKKYIVLLDDGETLLLSVELREVFLRRMKISKKGKDIPERLNKKYDRLQHKLNFKRQQLAEKYNGSFYQTEDGKEQLDYRHHVR